ncbi:MAG: DUF4886 domain-containing protein [Paludibacteraceae bacterium]
MRKFLSVIFLMQFLIISVHARQIRLLAIGNSFSEDAVENHLYDLVKANGDTIIIGNMYIGGCSLEKHYNNYRTDSAAYSYRKIVNGERTKTDGYTLIQAFENEKWDYVSFQQVSQNSGIYDTYFPYLDSLIVFAKRYSGNPDLKIILHATWAYSQNSTHPGFANYGNNQMAMFRAIVDATKRVGQKAEVDFIVPTVTAIQNARTSSLDDTFCRDGYHLELNYGRYTAACVWFEKLFCLSAIGSTYFPLGITPFQAKVAQYAAHYAVRYPTLIYGLSLL